MKGKRAVYPPLDRPKPVAEDLWIVDSGPLRLLKMRLPIRMAVVRLGEGLLLYSPTPFSAALKAQLEELAPIRYLLAPSFAHWQFVAAWQRACPEAETWAVPHLRQRRQVRASRLRIDRELELGRQGPWGEAIDVDIVPGAAGFREAALFHRPSGSLLLTDLIVNLQGDKLPLAERIGARLAGSLAPHGQAPRYLRLLLNVRRAEVKQAAERLVALAPQRVIFAHGKWFADRGEDRLRHALRWILR